MRPTLKVGSSARELPRLDELQRSIVSAIVETDADAPDDPRKHAVILGCPGSGRTVTALTIAKQLHEKNPRPIEQPVLVVAADRIRTDLIQPLVEQLLPGVVRPVRTPVSLAFTYTSAWAVERSMPVLAPQLLTGAQEDAELVEILRGHNIEWPEWITDDIMTIPAFRMELRNLLARAREAGWDATMLRDMGRRAGRDMWIAGAELMDLWDSSPVALGDGERPALLSAAQLQERAAHLITHWSGRACDEGVRAPLMVPYAVIVDDLQDCTGATLTLLEALAQAGSRVIATADSDVAVATYRGGEPHLDGRLQRALGAPVHELGPTYRGSLALRAVVQGVTSRVTVTGSAKRRGFGAHDPRESTDHLAVRVYGSQSQEMTAVAHEIRRHRLSDGVPLSDMVVIVRSSADVNRVRFSLMRHGIETTGHRRAINYASDQVTATLLDLLDHRRVTKLQHRDADYESLNVNDEQEASGVSEETVGPDTAEESEDGIFIGMDSRDRLERLVTSPLGGINPLALRRLIQASGLRMDSTSLADFAAQFQEAWKCGDGSQELRNHIAQCGLDSVVTQLFSAVRLVELGLECHDMDPRRALWRLWEAADVEHRWVERALVNSVESVIFDERLDAVISLMRTADVWSQRNPAGTAAQFAAELLSETLPTDNLSIAGQRPGGVHVLTAAQSVGRQWPVVFVSGIQDGTWPNLTLRDRLSRAGEVTEVANGNVAPNDLARGGNTMVAMRRSALNEELRMLAVAVSRATEYLTLTACRTEDLAPSSFIDLCASLTGTELADDGTVPTTQVPPGVDTRSLIARLRFILTQPYEAPHRRDLAAKLLALMSREGIGEADPARWTGFGGITDARDSGGRPRLTPSAIEVLLTCPARWFMTRHGGDVPSSAASTIGILVHEIAEQFPHGDPDTLVNELERRWDDHEFDRAHALGRKLFEETREKVIRMGEYFQSLGDDALVETELNVYVELDNAIITGTVDRVETVDDGVRVTDIKTGYPGTKKGTKDHLQLALYQYALNRLGYPVVGARLLALKDKKPEGFIQPSLFSGTDEANERLETLKGKIDEAVILAKGPTYPAHVSPECRTCPVHSLCPVRDEGLRTIE